MPLITKICGNKASSSLQQCLKLSDDVGRVSCAAPRYNFLVARQNEAARAADAAACIDPKRRNCPLEERKGPEVG
jgi:hypothetical protein